MSNENVIHEEYRVKKIDGKEAVFSEFKDEILLLARSKGISSAEIAIDMGDQLPTDGALLILFGFASKVAYDVWADYIWPIIKEKYLFKKQDKKNN